MKLDWKTCIKVGISTVLVYLFIHYWDSFAKFVKLAFVAAAPLIIGSAIAYVLNILMRFYESHYFPKSDKKAVRKSRRGVCLFLSFLTLVLIIFILVRLVVPQLVASVTVMVNGAPKTIKSIINKVEDSKWINSEWLEPVKNIDWKSKISDLTSKITSGFGDAMGVAVNVVGTVFSSIVTVVLSIIFAIYLLVDKEKIGRQFDRVMRRYMSTKFYERTKYVLSVLDDSFSSFISGQCIDAILVGIMCTIGMLILRLPYATMIGAIVAFTALIPVAGSYIGAIMGAFMILTVSPIKSLIFLIFIIVLQQADGNIVYPKIVGSSIGLPGIWVLAAVTVGGGLMGVLGMLIAVPIAATLYKILRADVNGKLHENIKSAQKEN
ncbi:MAG: AI-2E family transporter [Ezakiella sp.]|uniref:AI-2E family transporter n=1 Tax=Ezakiella sp. TaxID=1935205 RepID=UPI00297BBFC1|nr:AI-2E family transporter [Ezakiella sp.]MDD7730875.1 AI-2E family transporter [Eubacteriales bacterium]MDY6080291.1 AI-2E family transporter [Ezakiella sp.]